MHCLIVGRERLNKGNTPDDIPTASLMASSRLSAVTGVEILCRVQETLSADYGKQEDKVIGKVFQVQTCQDCCKGGSNKDNASKTSTLVPAGGKEKQHETQEDKKQEDLSECSPKLLADEYDGNKPVLDNKKDNPNDKGGGPINEDDGIITQKLNMEDGWWSICPVCTKFPCVWSQYSRS
jgi:hypothetical protein